VDRVEAQHEREILTRNGRLSAVLHSPEDLEVLEVTLELLADPDARAEIDQARRDIARARESLGRSFKARAHRRGKQHEGSFAPDGEVELSVVCGERSR